MARFTGKRRISRKRRSTRKRRVSRNIIYGGEKVTIFNNYDELKTKLKSLDPNKKKFYKIEIYNPEFPPESRLTKDFTLEDKDLKEWNYDYDPKGERKDNKRSTIQIRIMAFTRLMDNSGYKIFFTEPTE